jgi:hypothetical protein
MKRTIQSLILIIILSVIALFLKRKVNTPNIELESTNEPELTVVAVNEDQNEINENDMK